MDRIQKLDDDDGDQNVFYRQVSSKMFDRSSMETYITPASQLLDGLETGKATFCLPYIQSVLFACILEDAITQMRILDECNNELRIVKTLADTEILRAKKFQIKQSRSRDSILNIDQQNLDSMQYKLDKLAADRIFCCEVMTEAYLELSLRRCFSSLADTLNEYTKKEDYIAYLTAEEARNKLCLREVMRQLRQQRNHMKTVAYDTEVLIDQLRSRVEDSALNAETRARYIVNWQVSRSEQHNQSIIDKEKSPSESIKYYRRRTDQEQRIHSEVELLVNIFINETLMKVESWMNKYDTDMEAIDLKIQIMKNKHQQQVDRKNEMEETYAYHEKTMKKWIEFKEERVKARAYFEKMTKAAVIVQAWWRGLLVRLELGPYKPRRGPPPPKKPEKKKKK